MSSLGRQIAEVASSRENLALGMRTAKACGNHEWVVENRGALESYNAQLQELKERANEYDIVEAMELTNAPLS